MESTTFTTELAMDVDLGLSSLPKYLKSKYFYNTQGSKIFQHIMQMPEYYLTNSEEEIFQSRKQQIFDSFRNKQNDFGIVELGAGDGKKTKVLLEYFLEQKAKIKYIPIDISEDAVSQLTASLKKEIPELDLQGKIGDYFHLMEEINSYNKTDKVLLFLGSNIGNFTEEQTVEFLNHLRIVMNKGDKLFIGFDLKKDPEVILKAYNDPHGYTAAFNLNLLRRINEELGADFELLKFMHQEFYDPMTGTAKSYLISKEKQKVNIQELNKTIKFEKWEPIFMEMSQKYDPNMIHSLAEKSGFEVVRNFTDKRHYFMNSLWKVKG